MLRLRIDLTAFEAKSRRIFWRLERDEILHRTVHEYTRSLLHGYGISCVRPVTYLYDTVVLGSESPLIFCDGDLLRILPGTIPVFSKVRRSQRALRCAPNDPAAIRHSGRHGENGEVTSPPVQEAGTIESAEKTENPRKANLSGVSRQLPTVQKRGERQSRPHSKRVSFDVLGDENSECSSLPQMESTPCRNKVLKGSVGEGRTSSPETCSDAYLTALEATLGISGQSKTAMESGNARKCRIRQAECEYHVRPSEVGSGDSLRIAAYSEVFSSTSLRERSQPGSSNSGDIRYTGENAPNAPRSISQ